MEFAVAARLLGSAGRQLGVATPSFRTPPRIVGADRTLRRHRAGAVIAVRLRGRPWPAVLGDMIEGVVTLNALDAAGAHRLRADLWSALDELTPPNGIARPDAHRIDGRQLATQVGERASAERPALATADVHRRVA